MRVHWSRKASQQLVDITEALRPYSAAAAEKNEDKLIAASHLLADFPEMGRVVPEGNYSKVREVFVGNYRLVYTVGDFEVEVIAVLHQAQRR